MVILSVYAASTVLVSYYLIFIQLTNWISSSNPILIGNTAAIQLNCC